MAIRRHHSYFPFLALFDEDTIETIAGLICRDRKNGPLYHLANTRRRDGRQPLAVELWELRKFPRFHTNNFEYRFPAPNLHPFIFEAFQLHLLVWYLPNDLIQFLCVDGYCPLFYNITVDLTSDTYLQICSSYVNPTLLRLYKYIRQDRHCIATLNDTLRPIKRGEKISPLSFNFHASSCLSLYLK